MPTKSVIVIGAGIGGLVTAVQLASHGLKVRVLERAETPGGKMREVIVGGRRIDAGPSVFTMRWVFEEIFAEAGVSLADYLQLRPVEILARHAWSEDERLDLFADQERSVNAIGDFAGAAAAEGYRAFCKQARAIHETLDAPFIRASRPSPLGLLGRCGLNGFASLGNIKPYDSLWRTLGVYFKDQRLRQLFGRYSTYCGSSPFLAPATLMLIAHVEQQGVWLVEGGMHQTAVALARLSQALGATIQYEMDVSEILVERGRAAGVRLANGETIAADAVVFNGDVAALSKGQLGARVAKAVTPARPNSRSLSAITWNLVAETEGFPLLRHNVFFARDYAAEFDDLFNRSRTPREGTVYVCAQDRGDRDETVPSKPERLLCLLNAPATGDRHAFDASEIEHCEERVFSLLQRCGLRVHRHPENSLVTTPEVFNRLFPATGGALYGQATHGWTAAFMRPASRGKIPGLYLAGGSVHPGAGVPMVALSGRLAAASLLADIGST
ncbi:1-hydroxycarotenoid 3,4-desaturase CrtD [Thiocystis violascens]|uniref:Phytoene desaturase n=1 Tax=Thiocystis violascens (strain ATCC 17096 / DSM 198 / 6111) TaxID=765911 RepID=I3YAF4_THIV6|nr:1-hydroxycarotenoid 3,4-desaturase CrtD [Thiocystis violascens]AFL73972.1 phytoene desaturase [Thiocystis violascens DSM 198]